MVAPLTSSPLKPGHGRLRVERVDHASALTVVCASNPMRLLTPKSRGASAWVFASSFGGGLVAGDQTGLQIELGDGTRCLVGTQASTRVYRNPSALPCGHQTMATVGRESLLVFAPDPVQPFAGSSYSQRQEFRLAGSSSLALLDWFTAGRTARGERWLFNYFQTRSEVWVDDRRVFLDSLRFDPVDGDLSNVHRLGRFNCIASLLLMGPVFESLVTRQLEEIAGMTIGRGVPLLLSASRIGGGMVLRAAGESTEAVGRIIHRKLEILREPLGDDPWARKW
jgi:urease accessory protein